MPPSTPRSAATSSRFPTSPKPETACVYPRNQRSYEPSRTDVASMRMDAYSSWAVLAAPPSTRAELFRVLGDEDRLRLLALCAAEELTVGELATLLDESQPQVTRKSQALREAGLVVARREGTRILLRCERTADPVVMAALEAGHGLCLA